jgi:hypothetical protein
VVFAGMNETLGHLLEGRGIRKRHVFVKGCYPMELLPRMFVKMCHECKKAWPKCSVNTYWQKNELSRSNHA